jgi:hypothetical protein
VAKKALFSTLFGLLTQKTFARVYNLFFGSRDSGLGTPGTLELSYGLAFMLELCKSSLFSRPDFRALRKRVECFYFL